MTKLSIVITVLNDAEELAKTVESIRQTSGDVCEIVVIDDGSDTPVVHPGGNSLLYRNQPRLGVGPSRHRGMELASGEYALILDSHMRFEPGWYEKALERIEANPNVLYCCTCLGLSEGFMTVRDGPVNCTAKQIPSGEGCVFEKQVIFKMQDHQKDSKFYPKKFPAARYFLPHDTAVVIPQSCEYHGATMEICGVDSEGKKQVFEGKWKSKPEDNVELPCLMGASYLMSRKVFFAIGGFNEMRMWGSSEPYLSLKAWLAGYEIRLLKPVRIGHKFRKVSPYRTDNWSFYYNKMRAALTLLNDEEATFLICKIKEMASPDAFARAASQIGNDMESIKERQTFYRSIFTRNLRWYAEKFGIKYPLP